MVTIHMCNVLKGCLRCLWIYLKEPMELFVMRVGISSPQSYTKPDTLVFMQSLIRIKKEILFNNTDSSCMLSIPNLFYHLVFTRSWMMMTRRMMKMRISFVLMMVLLVGYRVSDWINLSSQAWSLTRLKCILDPFFFK